MKNILTIWVVATALMTTAFADSAASFINGNWYGKAVSAITYSNWGLPGVYNKITEMNNGQCKSTPFEYAGGMSPLDGEVSWHFRGPMHLKQFAVYTKGTGAPKRDLKATPNQRRHGHAAFHSHAKEILEANEKRGLGDMVTATINGKVVSWVNQFAGQVAPTASPVPPSTSGSGVSSSKNPSPSMNAGEGNWGRQAYYNAEKSEADGLVFLNNRGGAGSGVFDYTWGMSLSYASEDGTAGAASPTTLKDTLLGDNVEVAIFSDKKCDGDSCGTVRPGSVAYHGFDGTSKLFLIEFDMPLTGKTGFNADMPAAWILNAQIPRTMQYGPAECSCWTSGCGEWDIFEVLDSGNTRCKSTFHGLRSGGESDYFDRPTTKPIKAAIIFDGENNSGHITILPDDTSFNTTLSNDIFAGFVNKISVKSLLPVKEFRLPDLIN